MRGGRIKPFGGYVPPSNGMPLGMLGNAGITPGRGPGVAPQGPGGIKFLLAAGCGNLFLGPPPAVEEKMYYEPLSHSCYLEMGYHMSRDVLGVSDQV